MHLTSCVLGSRDGGSVELCRGEESHSARSVHRANRVLLMMMIVWLLFLFSAAAVDDAHTLPSCSRKLHWAIVTEVGCQNGIFEIKISIFPLSQIVWLHVTWLPAQLSVKWTKWSFKQKRNALDAANWLVWLSVTPIFNNWMIFVRRIYNLLHGWECEHSSRAKMSPANCRTRQPTRRNCKSAGRLALIRYLDMYSMRVKQGIVRSAAGGRLFLNRHRNAP